MEWIIKNIIWPLLKVLAKMGVDWAKKKIETPVNTKVPEGGASLKDRLQQETKLKQGLTHRLSPEEYNNVVEKLLTITRKDLCDDSKICRIIGTSTSLPSEMMSENLMFYHHMWREHAKEVYSLYKNGKYIAQRVICNPYAAIRTDATNNAKNYAEFFKWCDETYFEAKVLFKDYQKLITRYTIELQDFMLFDNKFVFGSLNPITEKEILCKIIYEGDKLLSYRNIANAVASDSYSKKIDSVKELTNFLESHNSWSGTASL